MFYFVRHGSTDYSQINTKIYQGFGVSLLPLTKEGVAQIQKTAKDARLRGADIILSSPYTRAVQTAAILSAELGIETRVETNLHEWLANKTYVFETDEVAEERYGEFLSLSGSYPLGEERLWESNDVIRSRVLPVLDQYRKYDKVIVTCHSIMIEAVTGHPCPKNGEIIPWEFPDF